MNNENEYLTLREAADLLRVSTRTLQIKTDQGVVQAIKIPGFKKNLYKRENIFRMLGKEEEKLK